MAGLSNTTKYTLPFKKIKGKANTSNAKPAFSESISSQLSIEIGDILGEKIPKDPQQAANKSVVEHVDLQLSPITGSNGLSYNIQFPPTYNGSFGSGAQGENVRNHTQIVKKSKNNSGFAKPDHSGGYVYKLEDDTGTLVSSGVSENWMIDPVAGILTSEEEITGISGGTVSAYVYTGDTLNEVLSGGIINIQEDGSSVGSQVSTINFTSGVEVTVSGNTATIETEISDLTTNDIAEGTSLPDGENNLYYTDSRVNTTVGNIRPTGSATFDGNGVKTEFEIAHGLGETPEFWIVTPTTDSASSYSHVEADDTNLYVNYDTPPPSGTQNMVINWMVSSI